MKRKQVDFASSVEVVFTELGAKAWNDMKGPPSVASGFPVDVPFVDVAQLIGRCPYFDLFERETFGVTVGEDEENMKKEFRRRVVMTSFGEVLGGVLKARRKERGSTLKAASEILGLSESAVSRFESGSSSILVGHLRRLATFYGTTAEHVLAEAEREWKELHS